MLLTVCTAVLVPAFFVLGYWQLRRAESGNTLSWAYVFEWPLFAGYLVYMWWRLRHERPATAAPRAAPAGGATTGQPPDTRDGEPVETTGDMAGDEAGDMDGDEVDEELAAYNRYLAALEESGRRKHW